MKVGLFILSVLGFFAAAYFFTAEFQKGSGVSHIIYLTLIAILFCKSVVGLMITIPEVFTGKKRFRIQR